MTGAQLTALTGKLRVTAGSAQPLTCARPAASGALLRRLVSGRAAERVPSLLGALFTLCGELHRLTAARALAAASGIEPDPAALMREELYLRAACLREHLLHMGFDWPTHAPSAHGPLDLTWLRGLPPLASAGDLGPAQAAAVSGNYTQLVGFAEQRLLEMTASAWRERFAAGASFDVSDWAAATSSTQPLAAWLHEKEARARRLSLTLRPLRVLDEPARTLPLLAAALRADVAFAEHPQWEGQPADTGAFSRAALPATCSAHTAYDLLGARMTELVWLCQPAPWLRLGALALGPGEAIAYTELARGLLVHWVKLAGSVVEDYRVVAPTDFCLHPRGALALRLAEPGLERADVQLLMAAFDPCVEVELAAEEAPHA